MALLKLSEFRKTTMFIASIQRLHYSRHESDIEKCYTILGIPEDSDQEKIRSTYLKLVKRFHPDSGTPEANSDKFQEIDQAFKRLLKVKSKERWCEESVNFEVHSQEYDIQHTAPQHRQYLSYDGVGIGTPSQREKQYTKIRGIHAAENVLNHRINKAQADEKSLMEKKPLKHKIKTKYGYDRLVEDLIQEAMSRGEFDNLAGRGKPLSSQQNANPYVDFVTHKMNQVLIENGFSPQWITLQKEIREEKLNFIEVLCEERLKLGIYPFEFSDEIKWEESLEQIKEIPETINKKIRNFNLVVPVLQKQMTMINFEKEAEKIAKDGKTKFDIQASEFLNQIRSTNRDKRSLFTLIASLWK